METYNATEARANLYKLIAQTNSTSEPVQITSKNGNAVLISESDWRAMQERLYLDSVPGLIESVKEAAAAPITDFTPMEEVDWD